MQNLYLILFSLRRLIHEDIIESNLTFYDNRFHVTVYTTGRTYRSKSAPFSFLEFRRLDITKMNDLMLSILSPVANE